MLRKSIQERHCFLMGLNLMGLRTKGQTIGLNWIRELTIIVEIT